MVTQRGEIFEQGILANAHGLFERQNSKVIKLSTRLRVFEALDESVVFIDVYSQRHLVLSFTESTPLEAKDEQWLVRLKGLMALRLNEAVVTPPGTDTVQDMVKWVDEAISEKGEVWNLKPRMSKRIARTMVGDIIRVGDNPTFIVYRSKRHFFMPAFWSLVKSTSDSKAFLAALNIRNEAEFMIPKTLDVLKSIAENRNESYE